MNALFKTLPDMQSTQETIKTERKNTSLTVNIEYIIAVLITCTNIISLGGRESSPVILSLNIRKFYTKNTFQLTVVQLFIKMLIT